MRWFPAVALVMLAAASPSAQVLVLKPPPVQRVTVLATVETPAVHPGGTATLVAEITPNPSIHVYAHGAKGFTPVTMAVSKTAKLVAGQPAYPAAELLASPGLDERVPVYSRPFRIVQPVTIARTAVAGEVVHVLGTITYESCDDRLCYPSSVVPVSWALTIR